MAARLLRERGADPSARVLLVEAVSPAYPRDVNSVEWLLYSFFSCSLCPVLLSFGSLYPSSLVPSVLCFGCAECGAHHQLSQVEKEQDLACEYRKPRASHAFAVTLLRLCFNSAITLL